MWHSYTLKGFYLLEKHVLIHRTSNYTVKMEELNNTFFLKGILLSSDVFEDGCCMRMFMCVCHCPDYTI